MDKLLANVRNESMLAGRLTGLEEAATILERHIVAFKASEYITPDSFLKTATWDELLKYFVRFIRNEVNKTKPAYIDETLAAISQNLIYINQKSQDDLIEMYTENIKENIQLKLDLAKAQQGIETLINICFDMSFARFNDTPIYRCSPTANHDCVTPVQH